MIVNNNLNVKNVSFFDKSIAKELVGITGNLDLSGDMVIEGNIESHTDKAKLSILL